jgi:hypothetical protein
MLQKKWIVANVQFVGKTPKKPTTLHTLKLKLRCKERKEIQANKFNGNKQWMMTNNLRHLPVERKITWIGFICKLKQPNFHDLSYYFIVSLFIKRNVEHSVVKLILTNGNPFIRNIDVVWMKDKLFG